MWASQVVRYRKVLDGAVVPRYAHGPREDAGMDLFAGEAAVIRPGEWCAVRTGICVELPPGLEGQVRPRSGLAVRHGVTLLNSPGTIDPGYRGEVRVLLVNLGKQPYAVRAGDRVAQLVVAGYAAVEWQLEETLEGSARGQGGFGSTGA